jgi:hypothetical protein
MDGPDNDARSNRGFEEGVPKWGKSVPEPPTQPLFTRPDDVFYRSDEGTRAVEGWLRTSLTAPAEIVLEFTRDDGGDVEMDRERSPPASPLRGRLCQGRASQRPLGGRGEPVSPFVPEHRQPVHEQRVAGQLADVWSCRWRQWRCCSPRASSGF